MSLIFSQEKRTGNEGNIYILSVKIWICYQTLFTLMNLFKFTKDIHSLTGKY